MTWNIRCPISHCSGNHFQKRSQTFCPIKILLLNKFTHNIISEKQNPTTVKCLTTAQETMELHRWEKKTQKVSIIVFFRRAYWANSAWIYMCSTTNCENGFVSETKSHAHVQEKSTLSGGGPGSQPAKMVATSDAEKAVYKKKWKKTRAEMLFTFLANISEALCSSTNSGSVKSDHVFSLLIEALKW